MSKAEKTTLALLGIYRLLSTTAIGALKVKSSNPKHQQDASHPES